VLLLAGALSHHDPPPTAVGLFSNNRVRYANTWSLVSRSEVLIVERSIRGPLICMVKKKSLKRSKEQVNERLSPCIEKMGKNQNGCSGTKAVQK
jgi:hypothetical protein